LFAENDLGFGLVFHNSCKFATKDIIAGMNAFVLRGVGGPLMQPGFFQTSSKKT
jgi:hypothetical protein